jgi:hypothetical protein
MVPGTSSTRSSPRAGPVVAFRVEDFAITRQAMADAGIEFIGDVQTKGGVSWQHFYSPDGTILEVIGPTPGRL